MTPLAAYLLLFTIVGIGFIFVHLVAGKLIRPSKPDPEKGTIYECGEPTIGSAWVQFDLRFYVVALLFVVFDVEVAFFFPWAVVFGKANTVANADAPEAERVEAAYVLAPKQAALRAKYEQEMADLHGQGQEEERQARADAIATLNKQVLEHAEKNTDAAKSLAWIALWDILVFFGVLLVGFAYLWKRGDLLWVKAVTSDTAKPLERIHQVPGAAASTSS